MSKGSQHSLKLHLTEKLWRQKGLLGQSYCPLQSVFSSGLVVSVDQIQYTAVHDDSYLRMTNYLELNVGSGTELKNNQHDMNCTNEAIYSLVPNYKVTHSTWIAGFEVNKREIPKPSNASLHVPSVSVFHSPLDFPNSLVCILEEAVSRG